MQTVKRNIDQILRRASRKEPERKSMNRSVKDRPEMIPVITLPKYRYDMNPYRNTARLPNGAYRAEKRPKMIPSRQKMPLSAIPANGRKELTIARRSAQRSGGWNGAFFLNHRNRITYNDLCRGCTHGCKQSFRAIIVLCPRYYSKSWKHRRNRYGR